MGTLHHITRLIARTLVLPAVMLMSSCIREDLSNCGLDVVFRYTYNIVEADAFSEEADWVHLYIFDDGGSLIMQQRATDVRGDDGFKMRIPLNTTGEYSLVAFAGSSGDEDFIIPEMTVGDSKEKLTAAVAKNGDGINSERLNSLLIGTIDANISGLRQTMTIDMMKCTHTVRVILMPIQGGEEINPESYEFSIDDKCGTLAFDASPLGEDLLTYKPCFLEVTSDGTSEQTAAKPVNSAIVAEFSTSRLIKNFEPRLVIRNSETQTEMMDINLTWLLTLQEIEEHRTEWSDQEYLDRQDDYAITFFIDIDTDSWFQSRIIVNGWVISFEDVEL